MISTAILTIGRILVMGLGSIQPSLSVPVEPSIPALVSPAPITASTTKSAVRDYASIVYPSQVQSPSVVTTTDVELQLTAEETALFNQTNQDREAAGLDDLTLDPLLCVIARNHSADMSQRGYFDHIAPGPGPATPMDRYLAALPEKPDYAFLGENIYFRSATETEDVSADEANNAFMRSEGHRANILQPKFTKVGIGFYRDPATGAFWVTEMFLRDEE